MNQRTSRALAHIDIRDGIGLEIGPLTSPVVAPDMGRVRYVDHLSTEGLATKYRDSTTVDESALVEIDFVHSDSRLSDVVGGERFDYVIASHVIEHVPDIIGWLAQIAAVLDTGGILSLIIPDKRYCFDLIRPLSTPLEMLDAHRLAARVPTPKQVYDSLSQSVVVDAEDAWRGVADPPRKHTESVAISKAMEALHGEYVDVHCWVFTPQSFLDTARFLMRIDLFPFRVVGFEPTWRGELEFFVSLAKVDGSVGRDERVQRQLASVPVEPQSIWGMTVDAIRLFDAVAKSPVPVTPAAADVRTWAKKHRWTDRVRLALPHKWGALNRAMRGRW